MKEGLAQKINALVERFHTCPTAEARYSLILEMGRQAPSLPTEMKREEFLVQGCQSRLYLITEAQEGILRFHAEADALISNGLAAIMTRVYSGEEAECILTHKPTFLEELGIWASLSPSRANGLASLHLRMQQEAVRVLAGCPR